MKRVCHVTSVHKPSDGRIFERECTSLAKVYDVTLIAPNVDDYEKNGVHVRGVNLPASRLKRQRCIGKVLKKMIEVDADVYHFHDPELMSLGLKMKKLGKRIIFDSHEDVPALILHKSYIPTSFLRKFISVYFENYEKRTLKKYDAVVSVTPDIVAKLKRYNPQTYMLTNYPIYRIEEQQRTFEKKIGFAGLVATNWNLITVLEAIKDLDIQFELAGPVSESYLEQLKGTEGWDKVNYHGVIKHQEVLEMLRTCSAGIALEAYDNPNAGGKKGSIGVTKIYEYMHEGIPVIATDLDNWVPIIAGTASGFCVDPKDSLKLKERIEYLLNNKEEAIRMGDNGRRAVKEKYCWQTQEKTLFKMYEKVLAE